MKVCTACGKEKPDEAFYWSTDSRRGTKVRHSKCQVCRRAQFSAYAKTDQGKKTKRKGILAREYGITQSDYDQLALQQGFRCAICQRPETKVHRDGSLCSLSIDHDHETGVVRGLLCSSCNVGLGSFDDCPEWLEAAAVYLQKGQAAKTEALKAELKKQD